MNWSLSQIAAAVNGRLVGADVTVEGVSTDTRAIAKGALFIALAGERFDAHDFLDQAVAAGAGGLLHRGAGATVPHVPATLTRPRSGPQGGAQALRGIARPLLQPGP